MVKNKLAASVNDLKSNTTKWIVGRFKTLSFRRVWVIKNQSQLKFLLHFCYQLFVSFYRTKYEFQIFVLADMEITKVFASANWITHFECDLITSNTVFETLSKTQTHFSCYNLLFFVDKIELKSGVQSHCETFIPLSSLKQTKNCRIADLVSESWNVRQFNHVRTSLKQVKKVSFVGFTSHLYFLFACTRFKRADI